jgi:C-terminal processing protease CtpA/Prc
MTITKVDENSAAARLNLNPGDVILKVNGKTPAVDWNQFLQTRKPNSHLRLVVSSAGESRDMDISLSTRKIDVYQFVEVPGVTSVEHMRRTAFLQGEAEAARQ